MRVCLVINCTDMFSDFIPIKYLLKVIEIVILYLALLFSGVGNTYSESMSVVPQSENTLENID